MDRVVFVMASGAKQLMRAQSVNANNLANVNTIGFQADLANFRAQLVDGPGYESRAYALGENAGARFEKGTIQSTGRPLDVAVNGDGWIAVQAMDGTEAYTRAGNLRVNINGQLLTGAGHPVMGESGPIVIPEFEKLEIGRDGTISVRPIGSSRVRSRKSDASSWLHRNIANWSRARTVCCARARVGRHRQPPR